MSAELAALTARVVALEARLAAVESGKLADNGAKAVADDADLDSEWGDELITKDPPSWVEKGRESYAGNRMSECPSDFLRAVASLNDWIAAKDEEKGKTYTNKKTGKQQPTAPLARKRAARARGWAVRNKDKAVAPAAANGHAESDAEIPF